MDYDANVLDEIYWQPKCDVWHVLKEIRDERKAQDTKWGEQNHPDFCGVDFSAYHDLPSADQIKAACDFDAKRGESNWGTILLEEFLEAIEEREPGKLREELIQVAAVCVAWVECIDRRNEG
jgi:hypothetical protein